MCVCVCVGVLAKYMKLLCRVLYVCRGITDLTGGM